MIGGDRCAVAVLVQAPFVATSKQEGRPVFDPTESATAAVALCAAVGCGAAAAVGQLIARRDRVQIETPAERAARQQLIDAEAQLDALRRVAEAREQYRAAVRSWAQEAYNLAGSDDLAVRRVERIEAEGLTGWPTADLLDRAATISHVLAERVRDAVRGDDGTTTDAA